MANEVYANGMEVACKAASGKSVAAFPDTCLSPPSPPAGPAPIPYPNTAYASDTTNGSTTVMISDQEVMLKDQSTFKKSTGDEAATKTLGMGVVTHALQGEASFIAWSMDVKIEGQNVDRHLDPMLHNEQCSPANTPPMIYVDRMKAADIPGCQKQRQQVEDACGKNGENFSCPDDSALRAAKAERDAAPKKSAARAAANRKINAAFAKMTAEHSEGGKVCECRKKMRCLLSPYEPDTCCPGQTPHHLVEAGAFHDVGRGEMVSRENVKQTVFIRSLTADTVVSTVGTGKGKIMSRPMYGARKYNQNAAPCVCCEGESQNQGTHKWLHQAQDRAARRAQGVPNPDYSRPLFTATGEPAKMQRLDSAIAGGVGAVKTVFRKSGCDARCLKAQLEEYHYRKADMNPELPIKAVNGQGKALPA
jgi:uncharacterized protein DUF4150/HNH/endonuclease VII toxin of polymorphic toxin system